MPFTPREIGPGETLGVSSDTIRALHRELATTGFSVGSAEISAAHFGEDTEARLRDFQSRHGLAITGSLDSDTGGVLALTALIANEPDRTKLRAELKDAIGRVPNSTEYDYWLARYALTAGDYETPKTLMHLHPGLDAVLGDLVSILDPGPHPQAPEVPYPENFYSYRRDLVDTDQLVTLRSELSVFTRERYAADLTRAGHPTDPNTMDAAHFGAIVRSAQAAVNAMISWQEGNRHAAHRELTLARQAYRRCQFSVADYLEAPTGGDPFDRIEHVLAKRRQDAPDSAFWAVLRWRRILLSLKELTQEDRERTIGTEGAFTSPTAFLQTFTDRDEFGTNAAAQNQQRRLDPLLIIMATVWVPLALGELSSQVRQFADAIQIFNAIVDRQNAVDVRFRYLCEFIEIPFIRLLKVEAMMGKADAEYKAGTPASAQPPVLQAEQTYRAVLDELSSVGHYVANVAQGHATLVAGIEQAIQNRNTHSLAFHKLGITITVPTVTATNGGVPGLGGDIQPHQPIAAIQAPNDPQSTNPRIYSIVLLATAKLAQISAGFNYLGYPPNHLPPWRFAYLLDRCRYFAEHAKNAQRDYLNFLTNAEHEEFQEQSLAQNVEMEKANVRMESARVDQAQKGVEASQTSVELADQAAANAESRFQEYLKFDQEMQMHDLFSAILGGISGGMAGSSAGPIGAAVGAELGFLGGINASQESQARRDLEFHNLSLAISEAKLGADVARARLAVDQSGLIIAGLQFQASVLRHEYAIQNLNYLRGQTLNADQWFRLANNIRSVSDTYLRYAVELAFLTQQAYQFESNRSIDVIRFDYDLSDVGAMLAADFLLRDLDTLEQDYITGQQKRQQQVRFILSMARECPDALRTLSENSRVELYSPLEQMERHFPGLFNLRIVSVDVQPVALMDPARTSVELTHLGTGMLRLKAQPQQSPLNNSDVSGTSDWLSPSVGEWPVKVHTSGPETAWFSGLSRVEQASGNILSANQRGAFEGLPAASFWKLELSTRENRIVPGTLADVIITFTVSGYYDSSLAGIVSSAIESTRPYALTTSISARRTLPDSYYSLTQYGKMNWDVERSKLSLTEKPGALRNVGVLLPLPTRGPEIGRSYCRYSLALIIDSGGNVVPNTALPNFSITADPNDRLTLIANLQPQAGQSMSPRWDFGDGSPQIEGSTAQHRYARPGKYELKAGLINGGRLDEYRVSVFVSAANAIPNPVVAIPIFAFANGDLTIATDASFALDCSIGDVRKSTGPASSVMFSGIVPNRVFSLDFTVTRPLKARLFGKQNFAASAQAPVVIDRRRIATNRAFDANGSEITSGPNSFVQSVFAGKTLAAEDRWTLEIPMDENPFLVGVSASDVKQFEGTEFGDAILRLEYDVI